MAAIRRFGLSALLCVALAGCVTGNQTPELRTMAAPNFPAAANLRRVAVLPFQGPDGERATLEFESMLAQVQTSGGAYFTVIDRRTLQNAMNELRLSNSGLVDPSQLARLGKFLGVQGIYTGTIFQPSANRVYHQEDRVSCPDTGGGGNGLGKFFSVCKNPNRTTVSCTDKTVMYTFAPRLVEVETARVVYAQAKTASIKESFCPDRGVETSDSTLLSLMAADALGQVRDDVAPHVVAYRLPLKTSPEGLAEPIRSRFNDAMAFVQGDRMDRACAIWSELSPAAGQAVAFNLAVCDELGGRLEDALNRYTAIDNTLNRPDNDVSTALVRVRGKLAQRAMHEAAQPPAALQPRDVKAAKGGGGAR
jgi:hypothetical protein